MNKVPSSEWTQVERLRVILAISSLIEEKIESGDTSAEELAALSQRISQLASKSSPFLEANRNKILEGLAF